MTESLKETLPYEREYRESIHLQANPNPDITPLLVEQLRKSALSQCNYDFEVTARIREGLERRGYTREAIDSIFQNNLHT